MPPSAPDTSPTISALMEQAEGALERNDFIGAKAVLTVLHEAMPHDASVWQKLVLATYKAKVPTERAALDEACNLLAGLNARDSTDTETLGLVQAVHKRLWALTEDRVHLDKAIWSCEKGFLLQNDYYNGINLAFLYNVRASTSEGADAVADFVLAQRTRRRVVDVCQALLEERNAEGGGKRFDRNATYWILTTLAEAWLGLGDEAQSQEYFTQARALDPPPAPWMIESTEEQFKKLRGLLQRSPLATIQ